MKLNRRKLRKMILKEMASMSDYQPNTVLIYPDRYTYEQIAPAYLEYLKVFSMGLDQDKARQAFFGTLGLSPSKAFEQGVEGDMNLVLRDESLNDYMRQNHGAEWYDYSRAIKQAKAERGAGAASFGRRY